jgi:hypothetical protein
MKTIEENNVKDRNFVLLELTESYKPQSRIELYGNVSLYHRSVTSTFELWRQVKYYWRYFDEKDDIGIFEDKLDKITLTLKCLRWFVLRW